MQTPNNDDMLRHIASGYLEEYGRQLKDELAQLEQADAVITPGLDRKVLGEIKARKRRRNFRIGGSLVACLLLALLLPNVWRQGNQAPLPSTGQEQLRTSGVMIQEEPAEELGEERFLDEPPMEEAEIAVEEAEPFDLDQAVPPTSPLYDQPIYGEGTIPLSFSLPPDLDIIAIEQDNEKSIYYLSDVMADDIILSLEMGELPDSPPGLEPLWINDTTAYGLTCADYSLLTFQKDGIVYEMTCRYDMDTLLNLSYHII